MALDGQRDQHDEGAGGPDLEPAAPSKEAIKSPITAAYSPRSAVTPDPIAMAIDKASATIANRQARDCVGAEICCVIVFPQHCNRFGT